MNEKYVPKRQDFTLKKPVDITEENVYETVMINGERRNLAFGLPRYPDSQQTQGWVETEPGHWSEFEGARVEIGIDIKQFNTRKVNDWKGIDNVYQTGEATITFDGIKVYNISFKDINDGLFTVAYKINKLKSISALHNHIKGKEKYSLIGRKVYYMNQPGVITRFHGSQGVFIEPEADKFLNPYPQDKEAYEWWEEYEDGLYVDILSENINWYRD